MLEKIKRQKSLIVTSNEEKVKRVLQKESLREKLKKEIEQERTNTIVQDKAKEMIERQNSEKLCRKLDIKDKVEKVIEGMQKPKENSSFKESLCRKLNTKDEIGKVNKGRKNKNNNLKEEIEERLKLIERSIVDIENDSLIELTKKTEILNAPFELDRKRDIAVLNVTKSSNNEKTDRHFSNTISHKSKKYGHTKKQCDRHNKNVKRISKLDFEKDVINELMEIFKVSQKEMDHVKKERELKSTNPLKVNKRIRKQKDIIMKLIDNYLIN